MQQFSLSPMRISWLGVTTGSDFSSTACTSVKIAVVAPMPSASVNIAVIVNPGVRINCRNAYRISSENTVDPHDPIYALHGSLVPCQEQRNECPGSLLAPSILETNATINNRNEENRQPSTYRQYPLLLSMCNPVPAGAKTKRST